MTKVKDWLESQEEYNTKEKREKVTILDISGKSLEGELDLTDFTSLSNLNFSKNKITKVIIGKGSKITFMKFFNNQDLDKIEGIENLTSLNIFNAGGSSFSLVKSLNEIHGVSEPGTASTNAVYVWAIEILKRQVEGKLPHNIEGLKQKVSLIMVGGDKEIQKVLEELKKTKKVYYSINPQDAFDNFKDYDFTILPYLSSKGYWILLVMDKAQGKLYYYAPEDLEIDEKNKIKKFAEPFNFSDSSSIWYKYKLTGSENSDIIYPARLEQILERIKSKNSVNGEEGPFFPEMTEEKKNKLSETHADLMIAIYQVGTADTESEKDIYWDEVTDAQADFYVSDVEQIAMKGIADKWWLNTGSTVGSNWEKFKITAKTIHTNSIFYFSLNKGLRYSDYVGDSIQFPTYSPPYNLYNKDDLVIIDLNKIGVINRYSLIRDYSIIKNKIVENLWDESEFVAYKDKNPYQQRMMNLFIQESLKKLDYVYTDDKELVLKLPSSFKELISAKKNICQSLDEWMDKALKGSLTDEEVAKIKNDKLRPLTEDKILKSKRLVLQGIWVEQAKKFEKKNNYPKFKHLTDWILNNFKEQQAQVEAPLK